MNGLFFRKDSGYALPLVVTIIAVLAVSIVSTTAYFQSSVRTIISASDRIRLRTLLDSGLELAAARVISTPASQVPSGSSNYRLSVGNIEVEYIAENGRVDLNVAENDLLSLVFRHVGMSEAETRSLLEKIQSKRLGLGQGQDAPSAGTPALYRSIDELAQNGVGKHTIADMQKFLTVFSGQKQIDPRNSDPSIFSIFWDLSGPQRRQLQSMNSSKFSDRNSWIDAGGKYARFFTFERARVFRVQARATLGNGMYGSSTAVILFYQDDDTPFRVIERVDSI